MSAPHDDPAVAHAATLYQLEQVRGWWRRNLQQLPLKIDQRLLLIELIEGEQLFHLSRMVEHLNIVLARRAAESEAERKETS